MIQVKSHLRNTRKGKTRVRKHNRTKYRYRSHNQVEKRKDLLYEFTKEDEKRYGFPKLYRDYRELVERMKRVSKFYDSRTFQYAYGKEIPKMKERGKKLERSARSKLRIIKMYVESHKRKLDYLKDRIKKIEFIMDSHSPDMWSWYYYGKDKH